MASSYDYDVIAIPNVPDLWTPYVFAFSSSYLYITVWDKPVNIQFSYDGLVYGDTMEIDPDDPPLEIPHSCKSFMMQNETFGLTARAQAVAFR
jgi:hypothetical protein